MEGFDSEKVELAIGNSLSRTLLKRLTAHLSQQEDLPALLTSRPQAFAKEPVFCFETAMKCYYYSLLVYDYSGTEDLRPVRA